MNMNFKGFTLLFGILVDSDALKLKVFILIRRAVEHFSSKIGMRFHNHPSSFHEYYDT